MMSISGIATFWLSTRTSIPQRQESSPETLKDSLDSKVQAIKDKFHSDLKAQASDIEANITYNIKNNYLAAQASLKGLATDTATFKASLQTKFQDSVTNYLTDRNNRVLMKQKQKIEAYEKRTNAQLEW